MSSETETQPKKSGAVMALARVGIAAVVLAGMYVLYAKYVENSKVLKKRSADAFELIQKDGVKEYTDALGLLDEALAIRSDDPFALSARAEVSALLWLDHGVEAEAAKARELTATAVKKEIPYPERYSAEATTLIAEGKVDDAESKLSKLAEQGGGAAKIVAALGLAHRNQGKLVLAKNDLKQAADRDWRSPRFTSLYGDAAFDAADYMTAQGAFSKALEQSPTHIRSLVGKARADVARQERVAEALAAFDTVLARPAEDLSPVLHSRALTGKAEALLASGNAAAAEAAAREAITKDPKVDPAIAYAHFALGQALAAQKKDGAVDAFKAAINRFPHVARFYFQGSLSLAEAGKTAEGEAILSDFTKTMQPNDGYHLARGDFFVATGKLAEAGAAYDEAIKMNEVNADGYYKKGSLLARQSRDPKANKKKLVEDALAQFEKAVRIRERFPEVYREVGLVYMDQNPKSGEALKQFADALKFYKEAKAPKAVIEGFIAEVEARYVKAGLAGNAKAWRAEASAMTK